MVASKLGLGLPALLVGGLAGIASQLIEAIDAAGDYHGIWIQLTWWYPHFGGLWHQ